MMQQEIDREETQVMLWERLEDINAHECQRVQSRGGKVFDVLADSIDDDGVLAEMGDLNLLEDWLTEVDAQIPFKESPDLPLEN